MSKKKQPKQPSVETKVLDLKTKGEAALKEFKDITKSLVALGFSVYLNKDDTLYIFKDVNEGNKTIREHYGTLVQEPVGKKV